MKKFKKNPKKQLEKFSTIFMQLGLVAVLFIVYITLEYKTELIKEPVDLGRNDNPPTLVFAEIPTLIKRVEKVTEKPKQRQQRTTIIEEPEIIDNNEKDFIEAEIVNDNDDVVEIGEDDIVEVVEEEEIKKEDGPVSMKLVQKAPIFKGCEGLSESKARACFEKSMKRLVQRHFNTDLANDLGLQRGKNRIITQFVIDEEGLITDIQIRAPHPRLKKETNRIIKKIPKFKPGIQNNQKAKVRYTLPIGFMVE